MTPAASRALEIQLIPETATLQPGEQTLVQVKVVGVPSSGLAAFQFDLGFNPAVVQLANPNAAFEGSIPAYAPLGNSPFCVIVRGGPCQDPSWLLTTTGRSPVGTDSLDNTNGTLEVAYGTSGTQEPPTGDGVIALINLIAQQPGQTTLVLSGVILADNEDPPRPFSFTSSNATITVTPEPSTLLLLAAGLALLGTRARGKSPAT